MRYAIARDREDGPLVVSPGGGVILYESMTEAGSAASKRAESGSIMFVLKLGAVAYYGTEHSPYRDN